MKKTLSKLFPSIRNADESRGDVWYGIHFYPGVAQYAEEGKKPYRVFLNEDTLREMDPTFAGCPVFVLHVDEVETDLDELRKEADGWVVESFYNRSDGKHWVKFITVSENGRKAIAQGMKLSNCYLPKSFGPGGSWNGIDYERQITNGVYEHLAIVPNPRYEESIIMSPDDFKKYNADKDFELTKLANQKGEVEMKLSFWKKTKVENAADIESMSVTLPKSGKEVLLSKLINDADEGMEHRMAHPEHHVEVNGDKMKVKDLVQAYKDACDAAVMKKDDDDKEEMKKDDDEKEAMDPAAENESEDQDMETAKKPVPMPEDDEASEASALKLEREEEKEVKDAKKKNAAEKAERLRNANKQAFAQDAGPTVSLSMDQVARGKALYGSN